MAQGAASAASNLSDLVDHTYQANGRVATILPVGSGPVMATSASLGSSAGAATCFTPVA